MNCPHSRWDTVEYQWRAEAGGTSPRAWGPQWTPTGPPPHPKSSHGPNDVQLDKFLLVLPSWKDVQNEEIWPPYQTTPPYYNPFINPRDDRRAIRNRYSRECGQLHPRMRLAGRTRYCVPLRVSDRSVRMLMGNFGRIQDIFDALTGSWFRSRLPHQLPVGRRNCLEIFRKFSWT